MRKSFLLLPLLVVFISAKSQSVGDYRTAANGNWNDAATWQRYNGATWVAAPAPPTTADGVVSILAHTITMDANADIDQLVFSSGTIQGAFSLTVFGNANSWNSGTLDAPMIIANAATITMTSNVNVNDVLTIQNGGSFTWNVGSMFFNNGTINNSGTITLNNAAGSSFSHTAGTNAVNNNADGSIIKNSGAGTFTSNVNVNNAGTFTVNTASFTQNGGTFTNTGTINIAAASTFSNTSIIHFNAGSAVAGNGTLSLANNTHNVNLALTVPSTITVNFSGGTLQGTGSLTINGTMNWSGGTLDAPLTMANGATATMTSNVNVNDVLAIQNGGSFTWNVGSMFFNNGTINNSGTITLNNAAGSSFSHTAGTNAVNNNADGSIIKNSGAGTFTSNVNANNAGTFTVNAASFTQNGGTFTNTGTINIAAASTFSNTSIIHFNTGSAVAGNGTLSLANNTHNLNLALTVPSTITVNFSGGTLQGTGSLTINGTMNWSGGTLDAPLTIANGATATMTSNVNVNDVLTIQNGGSFTWNVGSMFFNNGTINNSGTITLNNAAGSSFSHTAGTNAVNNNVGGVISKNSGAGIVSSSVNLNNAGTIMGVGTFNFTAGFVNTGTIAPGLSPGILVVNGTAPFGINSTLSIEIMDGSGAGTGHDQMQRASTLALTGTLTVIETGTVPPGDYVIISLTSGTITGTFTTTNLPPDYSVIYNSDNVVVRKGALATWYRDFDNDTYGDPNNSTQAGTQPTGYVSNNSDCNDNNANIHPGATEVCNGADDDCDGQIDEGVTTTFYLDADGDGFGNPAMTQQACAAPPGYVANNADCNDNNSNIYPGATEVCNGVDDDCDGQIDEGVLATFYRDLDGDGFGNPAETQQACSVPNGFVANNTDCNDNNAAVNPNTVWYLDADNDNYYTGTAITQCASPGAGYKFSGLLGGGDCNDANPNIHPNAVEICNNTDDDCDGQIDEGAQPVTWYQDLDGDGFGNPAVTQSSCTQPAGYVLNNTDCNDNNANIHPNAAEVCNGADDDCDGQIDEGVTTTFYLDADGDGFGNPAMTQQACAAPPGYVANNADCNDNNANIYPGATEVCNGGDDDCDGQIDEGVTTTFYQDADGDGFGNLAVPQQACIAPPGYVANNIDCNDNNAAINPNTIWFLDADNDNYYTGTGITQCASPGAGYKFSGLLGGGDCNDANPNIHPNAVEICNSTDDDCDGQIDEGAQPVTWYQDLDGDGFGNPAVTQSSCTQPAGYVLNNTDCNDNNANIHPNAAEVCNGADDDCDGQIDEGLTTTFYQDADGDGFGNPAVAQQGCSAPPGYVVNNSDCNDNNPNMYPGATEVCNGLDDDCDGQVDEGVQTTFYRDLDGDGFGDPAVTQQACTAPAGFVSNNTDCNDNNAAINPNAVWYLDADNDNYYTGGGITQCTSPGADYKFSGLLGAGDCNDVNPNINPGATEVCNGADDDCDGQVDEGCGGADNDGDGFSVAQGDCNDNDNTIYPDAPELCDGKDNDCDGLVDENLAATAYRSKQSGNWNDASTWEANVCGFWQTVTAALPANAIVTIQHGHTVTINTDVFTAEVTIDNGGHLILAANTLTITGDLTIEAGGRFSMQNATTVNLQNDARIDNYGMITGNAGAGNSVTIVGTGNLNNALNNKPGGVSEFTGAGKFVMNQSNINNEGDMTVAMPETEISGQNSNLKTLAGGLIRYPQGGNVRGNGRFELRGNAPGARTTLLNSTTTEAEFQIGDETNFFTEFFGSEYGKINKDPFSTLDEILWSLNNSEFKTSNTLEVNLVTNGASNEFHGDIFFHRNFRNEGNAFFNNSNVTLEGTNIQIINTPTGFMETLGSTRFSTPQIAGISKILNQGNFKVSGTTEMSESFENQANITGAGTIIITDQFTWTSGTVSNFQIIINPNAELIYQANNGVLKDCFFDLKENSNSTFNGIVKFEGLSQFSNHGNVTGQNMGFVWGNGPDVQRFINRADGTFDIPNLSTNVWVSNQGVSGHGTLTVSLPFGRKTNFGTDNFGEGGEINGDGLYFMQNSTLNLIGELNINANTNLSGATLNGTSNNGLLLLYLNRNSTIANSVFNVPLDFGLESNTQLFGINNFKEHTKVQGDAIVRNNCTIIAHLSFDIDGNLKVLDNEKANIFRNGAASLFNQSESSVLELGIGSQLLYDISVNKKGTTIGNGAEEFVSYIDLLGLGTYSPGNESGETGKIVIGITNPTPDPFVLPANTIFEMDLSNSSLPAGQGYDQVQFLNTNVIFNDARVRAAFSHIIDVGSSFPIIQSTGSIAGVLNTDELPQGWEDFYTSNTGYIVFAELCDGIDNDNDGTVDEGFDLDGDFHSTCNGDCDDLNPDINPGSPEICGDGIDNNCNGLIDENCTGDPPNLNFPKVMIVKEGNSGTTQLDVVIKLTGAPVSVPVLFNYSTIDETTTAGLDYLIANGSATIPAGQTFVNIPLSITGDQLREGNEWFRLNLSNITNAEVNGPAYVRIMIQDDERGQPNVKAGMESELSADKNDLLPKIPNVARRNNTWQLPAFITSENNVIVFNQQGEIIFRENNYRNSVSLPNVSSGIYFYQIVYRNENGEMIRRTGKLLITE